MKTKCDHCGAVGDQPLGDLCHACQIGIMDIHPLEWTFKRHEPGEPDARITRQRIYTDCWEHHGFNITDRNRED